MHKRFIILDQYKVLVSADTITEAVTELDEDIGKQTVRECLTDGRFQLYRNVKES